ncbi:MAG TPA: P1 family peptidase [Nitrolancea sp.]|nr:P1 family peptidase [Nitrolancea sp.]
MHDDGERFALPGYRVGHWTHPTGATGCTVVLPDEPALAVVDVRGGAPGTRETSLLDEGRLVQHVDAVLLTGGSAFGLAAADGVMRWLREQGRGFPTASIPVPIVPAAVIFDLHGSEPVWPDAEAGYSAARAAEATNWLSGPLGAGAGATVGKIANRGGSRSGLGAARLSVDAGTVAALLAVNAVGEIAVEGDPEQPSGEELLLASMQPEPRAGENTTIGVVVVDAPVCRDDLVRIAIAAHDGLARSIHPAHTPFDGDTIFVLGRTEGRLERRAALQLAVATQHVVMRAVQNSFKFRH